MLEGLNQFGHSHLYVDSPEMCRKIVKYNSKENKPESQETMFFHVFMLQASIWVLAPTPDND